MKRITLLLLSACLCAPYAAMSTDTPAVEKRRSGFYWQTFKHEGLRYVVDPVRQLCFVAVAQSSMHLPSAISSIPCGRLKRRPKWRTIITW
jgi:hypothetical protein